MKTWSSSGRAALICVFIFSVTLAQQKFTPAPGSSPSPQPLNDSQQKSGVRPPSRSSSRLGKMFDDGEWVSVTSKFHFVDLAGSERVRKKIYIYFYLKVYFCVYIYVFLC